jgi:hypothetical protein
VTIASAKSGAIAPHREINGRRATFLDLSSDDVLRSPIIVKVVQRMVELITPAKKRKMAQLARLVANPILKQQMNMPHSPISVTRRLPMRSAR